MPFDPEALPVPDLGLLCFGCGYPLASLTSHRCPECGKPFTIDEHTPPGDFPVLILHGKELDADKPILDLFQAHQITFLIQPNTFARVYGISGPSRLAVARNQYFEAINLLRLHEAGRTLPTPPAPQRQGADWPCPACRESNPANFELCWNCGAQIPAR